MSGLGATLQVLAGLRHPAPSDSRNQFMERFEATGIGNDDAEHLKSRFGDNLLEVRDSVMSPNVLSLAWVPCSRAGGAPELFPVLQGSRWLPVGEATHSSARNLSGARSSFYRLWSSSRRAESTCQHIPLPLCFAFALCPLTQVFVALIWAADDFFGYTLMQLLPKAQLFGASGHGQQCVLDAVLAEGN